MDRREVDLYSLEDIIAALLAGTPIKQILIVSGTRLRFDGPGPIISDVGGVE